MNVLYFVGIGKLHVQRKELQLPWYCVQNVPIPKRARLVLPGPLFTFTKKKHEVFAMPIPQTRHWCFTLNNWEPEHDIALQNAAASFTYLIYGYEKCPTTGTKHLQGYVVFPVKKRFPEAKALLPSDHIHIEPTKGTPQEAAEYCKKEGLYQEFGVLPSNKNGVSRFDYFIDWILSRRDNGDPVPSDREICLHFPALWVLHERKLRVLAEHHYPAPSLESLDSTLRPWQQCLYDALLNEQAGDRKVLFYVDTRGGTGKTFFQRYMLTLHPDQVQVLSSAKRDDVAHALDPDKSIFLFNIPRGGMEYLPYQTIEQIKDRVIFSPKYNSRTKILKHNAHVVIFCNELPDFTRMSDDRYVIMNLDE